MGEEEALLRSLVEEVQIYVRIKTKKLSTYDLGVRGRGGLIGVVDKAV